MFLLTLGSATISSDATKINEPAAALPLGGGHAERFMQLCRITEPSFPVFGSLIMVDPINALPSLPKHVSKSLLSKDWIGESSVDNFNT